MVQAHDAARSVPKYVRDAVKALDRYARPPGAVVDEESAPRRLHDAKEGTPPPYGAVHARSAVSSCNSHPSRTSRSASAADTN